MSQTKRIMAPYYKCNWWNDRRHELIIPETWITGTQIVKQLIELKIELLHTMMENWCRSNRRYAVSR